jgi:hypothetical protein
MKSRYAFLPVLGLLAFAGSSQAEITYTVVDPPASGFTYVAAVSGGTVVGGYTEYINYQVAGHHGFIYDSSTYTKIDVPGSAYTECEGIDGNTIVGTWYAYGSRGNRGFIYDGQSFKFFDVPGANNTNVTGVSGGKIVGYDEYGEGFIYDGSTFTTLSAPGAGNTYITGISGGTIVGYKDSNNGKGFIYDGSTFTTLDFPGAYQTRALAISGGTVVGTCADELGNFSFIYDGSSFSTLDLPYGFQPTGISGHTLVGDFFGPLHFEGFIAQVPEPASGILFGTAGLGLLAFSHRSAWLRVRQRPPLIGAIAGTHAEEEKSGA